MDQSQPPTSSTLLSLCNLPSNLTSEERVLRLNKLQSLCIQYPSTIADLLTLSKHRDKKTGCMPLHWLAGTGFNEGIDYILSYANEHDIDISIDQLALHPSTNRTPLHYAARNGHLSTCKLLIEQYNANSHPKCGRGGVTPLQLVVWQNRLNVVQYLVDVNGEEVVHERNGFNCGLMHWLGLVPRKRWGGDIDNVDNEAADDGAGVLSLARYLHSLGISYESTIQNSNTQGHSPNHKAAWGGNLSLLQYFRDEHNVYDTYQDLAGNYCADIAKMRGNIECYNWLLEHGSGDRADSYNVLGLDVGVDMDTVRSRYFELARLSHPDKITQHNDEKKEDMVDEFVKIKAAYEHLTKEAGKGKQSNPKYSELKLLEDHRRINPDNNGNGNDDDDMFVARLIAVISDYGDDGFPVSLIARRWNQIWPDRPFPTEYVTERSVQCSTEKNASGMMIVKKKVNLLKWLKWRCKGTSVYFKQSKGDVLAFDGSTQTKNDSDK